MSRISLTRVSPMTTIQDNGRSGMLAHGIGASGPMDRTGYARAAAMTGAACGAAIEIGPQGTDFTYSGAPVVAGFAGGQFALEVNGIVQPWPTRVELSDGSSITVRTGSEGNYAYLRFTAQIGVPQVLGSRATNATVRLGGLEGRALGAGDHLDLVPLTETAIESAPRSESTEVSIRVVWGLHADLFSPAIRRAFTYSSFRVSSRMDRMGVRLDDTASVFAQAKILGLVSDAVVPGDIQILGDGTPIVLMRDHQPTGGYPRIATVIDADLDRFAQIRPGRSVQFASVTVDHAHAISGWRR